MAEVHRDNVRASASTSSGLLDPVPPPVLQEQTAMDISPSKKADGYSSSSSKSTKLKDSRSGHRSKQLHFPLSRVRTIMKCAPDISNINQECVYVMTRATELFVEEFSRVACNQAAKSGRIYINYDDLADCVQAGNFKLRFLNDVVPQKILARDALEYYHKKVNGLSSEEMKRTNSKAEGKVPGPSSSVKKELPDTLK